MKKTILRILALGLAVLMVLGGAPSALAAEETDSFRVRVNGVLVDFPDTQPYVDSNSRTMVPVRFVSEQLGAKVDWEQATKTAIIEKDGTTARVQIGNDTLSILKGGNTSTIKMDTVAVNKDGRTMVPVRFVAEALGANVDWSQMYRTAQVFSDVLTSQQIEKLKEYKFTMPGNYRYNDATYKYGIIKQFGSEEKEYDWFQSNFKDHYKTFADAREYAYEVNSQFYADQSGKNFVDNVMEFVDSLDKFAREDANGNKFTYNLITDSSMIHESNDVDVAVIRGYMKVTRVNNSYITPSLDNGYDYNLNYRWIGEGIFNYYDENYNRLDNDTFTQKEVVKRIADLISTLNEGESYYFPCDVGVKYAMGDSTNISKGDCMVNVVRLLGPMQKSI